MSIKGADVSGWQPGQVNMAGLDFVYVKATEGIYMSNLNHDAQVAEARAGGLIVGHYHFPSWGDPVTEAQAFLIGAKWQPGDFMVLDIENSGASPWPGDPVSWCVAFENEVARQLGVWCLDYLGPSSRRTWHWGPLAALGGGLISPEYNPVGPSDPSPWTTVAMWQNADTNQTGGDSDVFYGDRNALIAYGTPGAVTQSGTITPIQEADVVTQDDINAITNAVEQRIFGHLIANHEVAGAAPDTFENAVGWLENRIATHLNAVAGGLVPIAQAVGELKNRPTVAVPAIDVPALAQQLAELLNLSQAHQLLVELGNALPKA